MKFKKFILGLAVLAFMTVQTVCLAKVEDSTIRTMVNKYKTQNYLGCIQDTDKILQEDPSNIYAYYYKGLSYYQLGKHPEANDAFTKVQTLNSNKTLVEYATKAKYCIISPPECNDYINGKKTELDSFIESNKFFASPVQSQVNQKKLDRIRENINEDLGKKSEMPTNEEIANAVKTLAKLGFNPMASMGQGAYQNPEMMQMSMLLGNNQQNNMNMLPFFMMNQGNTQNMPPELIQTMMMNQMTPAF